jgi:hypothetical protein
VAFGNEVAVTRVAATVTASLDVVDAGEPEATLVEKTLAFNELERFSVAIHEANLAQFM